ncbi:GGDEF domain-containing protein [Clostridium algidicarnis]|uniref:GGDEF domain-containing protein n=2 Tax=Clostridium algidicarnis TaxID=37659 RepID=UPI001C0B4197|nr:GGDEF domain-containing protein [Clostridium algidicarnis]MBU3193077.1 diguanylate cyclase [Clostridium algidicarnis]
MNLVSNLVINIYSITLLVVILCHSLKNNEKQSRQYKIFIMMLQITILMLILDILSRFDGKPNTVYTIINHVGNFLISLASPILASLWLLYVDSQIFHEHKRTSRISYLILGINVGNVIMVVLTQFFGWFYYIDSNNIYHRGPLFLLSASITVALIALAFVLITVNQKNIEKKYYFSLVFFAVPPLICIILQVVFYGISLMLNSVVLSLLIVFLNIQNQSMHIDYLTGINNRKRLEAYLKQKVSTSNENKTFSAIMMDLDDFKSINDTFGHDVGDDALKLTAKLLKNCTRSKDFIARFGGDEFCIVLDISNKNELDCAIRRINDCTKKYNESSGKPYKISFSMGYAVYDYNSRMSVEEFQKQIDILMYENKRINKEIKNENNRIHI